MFFTKFDFTLRPSENTFEPQDVIVSSEVWAAAHVEWDGLMKSDREWLYGRLNLLLTLWGVEIGEAPVAAQLRGPVFDRDEIGIAIADFAYKPDDIAYVGTVHHHPIGGAKTPEVALTPWNALGAEARDLIFGVLREILDALHAHLIIEDVA